MYLCEINNNQNKRKTNEKEGCIGGIPHQGVDDIARSNRSGTPSGVRLRPDPSTRVRLPIGTCDDAPTNGVTSPIRPIHGSPTYAEGIESKGKRRMDRRARWLPIESNRPLAGGAFGSGGFEGGG